MVWIVLWLFLKRSRLMLVTRAYSGEITEHEDDSYLRVEAFGSPLACARTGTIFAFRPLYSIHYSDLDI
jgi:hypothetical protein